MIEELTILHGTDKVQFIQKQLNIPSDIQEYTINEKKYYNLVSVIDADDKRDSKNLFTAHHDVANKSTMNILDNNASIYNLIKIANSLKPRHSTIIAFTDAEETCSIKLNGVRQILKTHNISQHLDFELTASGRNLVIDTYGDFNLLNVKHLHGMPYNNARASRHMDNAPIGSACLTIVDDSDLKQLRGHAYCDRWMECHKTTDTMKWFSDSDTQWFIDYIIQNFE